MAVIDPSTGHPYTRPGAIYIYSNAGAAPIRNTEPKPDTDRPPFIVADHLTPTRVTDTHVHFNGPDGPYALPLVRNRNTRIPTYRRTAQHAAPYDEHARTYDRIWCQLFGPVNPEARHARSDRTD